MKLEPRMVITVEVTEPIDAGITPKGQVRLIPFTSGRFEAGDVRGVLLPGGTDWQLVRADGVLEIRAHYLLETEQGERIEVISEGLRHALPGVLERIAQGENVPADQYYFRTCVRMSTASERLAEFNRTLFVAVGERSRTGARMTLYAVP